MCDTIDQWSQRRNKHLLPSCMLLRSGVKEEVFAKLDSNTVSNRPQLPRLVRRFFYPALRKAGTARDKEKISCGVACIIEVDAHMCGQKRNPRAAV